MHRIRHVVAFLALALAGFSAGSAWSQFNPFSGVVSAIEAAAEDRAAADIATDAKIKTVIVARLTDKLGREGALLGVDVYEQEVMLTGTVPMTDLKAAAGKVASGVEGVKKVYNEVLLESEIVAADKGKSTANIVDDTVIEAKIKALYIEGKNIHATNWRWRSVKGRVFLFGRALTRDEHAKAAQIAKDVSGVVSVVNRAKIRSKS